MTVPRVPGEPPTKPPPLARVGLLLLFLALTPAIFLGTHRMQRTREIERQQERRERDETYRMLAGLADDVRSLARRGALPACNGTGDDGNGHGALVRALFPRPSIDGFGRPQNDGWGHPLIYRCPGPAHPLGWDLYSVGPNGADEGGGGDDILVGEDVATVSSR